jgi:hypothetical protein
MPSPQNSQKYDHKCEYTETNEQIYIECDECIRTNQHQSQYCQCFTIATNKQICSQCIGLQQEIDEKRDLLKSIFERIQTTLSFKKEDIFEINELIREMRFIQKVLSEKNFCSTK